VFICLHGLTLCVVVAKNRMLQLDSELAFYQDLMIAAKSLNPSIGPIMPITSPHVMTDNKSAAKPRNNVNRSKRPIKKETMPVQGE